MHFSLLPFLLVLVIKAMRGILVKFTQGDVWTKVLIGDLSISLLLAGDDLLSFLHICVLIHKTQMAKCITWFAPWVSRLQKSPYPKKGPITEKILLGTCPQTLEEFFR
jgi:hypothetical protein